MSTTVPQQIEKPIPRVFKFVWIPSHRVEYLYYFVFSYSILAAYLHIEVPLLAASMTVALACFCYTRIGSRAKEIYAPIALLLACQLSFIVIQIVVHEISVTEPTMRTFMLWICGMIIVQSLCLRSGFLRRCTIVLFLLGLIAVLHLGFTGEGEVERASVAIEMGGGLRNANGLAGWFGFCTVSFAILGIETKRGTKRILYWMAATGCLFVVGLTVSRGPIFGTLLALTVAFRGLLRRGFVPALLLIILTGIIYESGLFDQAISRYEERGMEETGREKLWPDAIDRIFASPFIGVGISNIGTDVMHPGYATPPHNSFLLFALSSGVVPFAFWLFFWIQSGWRSFSRIESLEYGSFRIPFLLYVFVILMLTDLTIEPWVLLSLSVGAGSAVSQQLLVRGIRGSRTAQSLGRQSRAANL